VGGTGTGIFDLFRIQGSTAGVTPVIVFNNAASAGNNILRIGSAGSTGESWLDSYAGLHFGTGNSTFATNERMTITSAGNVGISTTSPYSRLTVWGPDTATTSAFAVVNNASTTVFAVYDNGNATYSGSIFQSSDQRLKSGITSLDASSSLAALNALNPVSYSRLDQPADGQNLGFIAQQVAGVFPQLVSTTSATALTPDGTLTLNYVGLIAPMVKAIQALGAKIASIENTIGGFAQSISTKLPTANIVNSEKDSTQELCVGSTCVTPAQFQAMVAAANQSNSSNASASASNANDRATTAPVISGTSTPPSITIAGNNPATIHVGDTYNNLGATAKDSVGHDLGLKYFLNGMLVSNIVLDTGSVATDTIEYVATDSAGNSATSTRVLIIDTVPIAALTTATTSSTASSTTQ
jgi:hypothetical protein